MFEHRLHLSKIGHIFLNGVSLSDLIWTYVVTGAYCLVQGRVWRFYQRNKDRLDPLSGLINLITPGGKQQSYVYNLRGVMEICRFNTHPGGFMAFETIWNLCTVLCISVWGHTSWSALKGTSNWTPILDSNDGMSFLARCHEDSSLQHQSQDQRPYRLYIS